MSVVHLLLILLWMMPYVSGTVITDFNMDSINLFCVNSTLITLIRKHILYQ
jgi:hypothetical protein